MAAEDVEHWQQEEVFRREREKREYKGDTTIQKQKKEQKKEQKQKKEHGRR